MNNKISNYFSIHPGNNSSAIQKALQKRGNWSSFPAQKDYLQAVFHWQQLNYSHKVYEQFNELSRNDPSKQYLLNHFENNHVITTKSGLIKTLKYYYSHQGAPLSRHIFQAIPTSFIIHAHKETTQLKDFKEKFQQLQKKQFFKEKLPEKHLQRNIWFIKPQSDNQGKGIILSNNWKQIQNFLISKPVNSGWIVQKAIQRPLLYNDRKFDVRVWVLVSPLFEVYYYNCAYMRTSSNSYNLDSMSSQIHLTNNCQQKHFQSYSKFQQGNTLPFAHLRQYLLQKPQYASQADLIMDKIVSKMKQMIIDTMLCAKKHFNKTNSKKNQFQLFGYDFLIDQDFRTYILEVNNNPYIGTPNKFIKGILPAMIDQMLQIIVDPFYPPQNYTPVAIKRFELLTKERLNFRVGNTTSRNSTTNSIQLRKNQAKGDFNLQNKINLFSIQKSNTNSIRSSFYTKNHSKLEKIQKSENGAKQKQKFKYATPSQNLKYLLQNYCYVDLDPFYTPVSLILSSQKLGQQSNIQSSLKTLRLISQTRVSSILLQPKFLPLCERILTSSYPQKIKSQIIRGYENSSKNFKSKLYVLQKIVPILTDLINKEIQEISDYFIQFVMRLFIRVGGYVDKVFIPGVTKENQKLRKIFITTGCFSMLMFLSRTYTHLCVEELTVFMTNLSHQDWDLFYDMAKNKGKRAYSPRSVTLLMSEKDSSFNFTLHEIKNYSQEKEEKKYQSKLGKLKQNKSFRTRRHSAFPLVKK